LLPVYNSEAFIAKAIESILAQSFTEFELIVIDDFSTDETASIVSSYKDQRIRLIRNDLNSGPGISLNKGILHAKADLIAIMHADDIATPHRLEKQYNFLEVHPTVDILGTQFCQMSNQGIITKVKSNLPVDPEVVRYSSFFNNCLCHPTVMFRKKITSNGHLYASLRLNEDYEYWTRSLTKGYNIANLSDVCLYYRVHANQASTKFAHEEDTAFQMLRNKYRNTASPELQQLIIDIEGVNTASLEQVAATIKQSQLPEQVKRIFTTRLSFYIHDILKKKSVSFNIKEYLSFLQVVGWRYFRSPIIFRLLLNRSL
jgi:glycosyltransferase involved in cell wall biosynthesis